MPRYASITLPGVTASLLVLLAGCAGPAAKTPVPTGPTTYSPYISNAPADLTVPMGLTATFTARANGSSYTAQWNRNGSLIAGTTTTVVANSTTDFTYTTPATTWADTGATFTLTVTNSAGSATSSPATLTVGARAPQANDLRFQQVDSPSIMPTANSSPPSIYNGGRAISYSNTVGEPFAFRSPSCASDTDTFTACSQIEYIAYAQPAGVSPITANFIWDTLENYAQDFTTPSTNNGNIAIGDPHVVVTSLQIYPTPDLFGVSYNKSSDGSTYQLAQHTIAPSALATAAQQEGLQGRVITALSPTNGGNLEYYSYSWSGDTTTTYETTVATATMDTYAPVATTLAGQGYIITAIGGDPDGTLYFIGTRVTGDTMARPIIIANNIQDYTTQYYGGYAIVGFFERWDSTLTHIQLLQYLGER